MKVLMTADAVGGVWTYSLDLARGLHEEGVDVVLAVMGPPPTAEALAEAEALPGLQLEVAPYRLEWMSDPWEDVAAAGHWLLELERDHQVDLVHLNGFAHGAWPFKAPVVVVGHSCVYGWWEAVHGGKPPEQWRTYRNAVRHGLQGADLVIAPTASMLRSLGEHYGPFSTPMVAVPNGRSPFAENRLAKDPMVLWVGRLWDAAKNVMLMEEAAQEGLPWPVVAIGDEAHPEGQDPPKLSHVRTTGVVPAERLKTEYERASIFVSTARYEPFGLNALEAAQAGCALVLPDIPSLRENWADVAMFYRSGDASDLVRTVRRLAADRALLRRRGEKARLRATAYTHREMARSYLTQYDRLAGDARKGVEVGSWTS